MVLGSIKECDWCKCLKAGEFEEEEVCVKEMRSAESSECLERFSGLWGRCLERSKQEIVLVLVQIV